MHDIFSHLFDKKNYLLKEENTYEYTQCAHRNYTNHNIEYIYHYYHLHSIEHVCILYKFIGVSFGLFYNNNWNPNMVVRFPDDVDSVFRNVIYISINLILHINF